MHTVTKQEGYWSASNSSGNDLPRRAMRLTKAAKDKAIIFDQQGAHKGSRWQHSGNDEEAGDMILVEEIGA